MTLQAERHGRLRDDEHPGWLPERDITDDCPLDCLYPRTPLNGISPRQPLTALLVLWGVAGVFRLAGRQLAWWWVSEQDLLRSHAVASADSREWMKLHREAKDDRRFRGIVLAAEAFALLVAGRALARVRGLAGSGRGGGARAGPAPGRPRTGRSSPRP